MSGKDPTKTCFCIHCGESAPAVYKIYGKDNLVKLLECTHCGQLVDKFVEYDLIIVIINLILQEEAAYRHLLLNSELKNFWKVGLLFLMTESYCFWCFHKGSEMQSKTDTFYELEANFYQSLLRSLVNTLSLHLVVLAVPFSKSQWTRPSPQFSFLALWKGMIVAGYTALFELCRLVWSYSASGPRMYFRDGLLILSFTQAYKVVNATSRLEALATVILAFALQKYAMAAYDAHFPIT